MKFEFHRYNAKHAFANETADSKKLDMLKYDPKTAETAWQRTMEFLERAPQEISRNLRVRPSGPR